MNRGAFLELLGSSGLGLMLILSAAVARGCGAQRTSAFAAFCVIRKGELLGPRLLRSDSLLHAHSIVFAAILL